MSQIQEATHINLTKRKKFIKTKIDVIAHILYQSFHQKLSMDVSSNNFVIHQVNWSSLPYHFTDMFRKITNKNINVKIMR